MLRQFIKDIVGAVPPRKSRIEILEQQVPGDVEGYSEDETEQRGLPDAWIHDGGIWAILIECKVQAALTQDQLRRHLSIAKHLEFSDIRLLVIGVKQPRFSLPHNIIFREWPEIYRWLRHQTSSIWAQRVAQYLEIWEGKMTDKGYLRDVAVTSFTGITFGEDEPYNYTKAKICLNALMKELRHHKKLNSLYKINKVQGRGQITGRSGSLVWDYIPFADSGSGKFTGHPHLTFVIKPDWTQVQITLPNSAKAQYWTAVTSSKESLKEMLLSIHGNLKRGMPRNPSKVKLWVEVLQRHYRYQKDVGVRDGELYFDVDCLLMINKIDGKIKTSNAWLDALYSILSDRKKTNTQLAIVARYDHVKGSIVAKPEFVDESVRALGALKPFYHKIT